ncbi:MAG: ComEC/Rec2-related protein, competence protein ComEC [Microgenomates group bacterium GW2011_GWC1_43_11]|uniref:Competence protein ComEC n=2 Tax=Candidatus Gottesmaniibacteriota TaxID=1752720 RepID=A0A0G1KRK7_9BACT|nr:MAG: ComEC/Rec2-related protein, competence protein ComEC [Microgenomates group bacterium GW2011_GWC1_43_11]KKT37942.1 MAG: Competence protein ComEC [Candidatus Gottesmanbacteria bacterium GW2011_GWB1_44_11c]KKT58987.1 MAG: Competence protein ComEC [Candidatus Gottesmanbacteria bacterium GW2011_GWA1_44_24b]
MSVSDFTSIINQLLPEPHAGLLAGILFGVKTSLDPSLKDALIKTGTLHIIALSGMNITILTAIVETGLLWFFPRKIAALAAIAVIAGFIWFVGPSASIVRAGIMAGIAGIGILLGKPVWALWSWGVAVILMLMIQPLWILDLSFQLSVLASLGMILFGGHPHGAFYHPAKNSAKKDILRFIDSLKNMILVDLRTTLAAQTLTIPLLFFTFGRLSFISPLTNVCIVWTLPIVTVLGFLVSITGYFFLPVGQVFAWFSWVFLEYIIHIITWTSRIPGASVGT